MSDNYNFVPIELAVKFEKLAAKRGVSRVARGVVSSTQSNGGFFQIAKKTNGSRELLRQMPIRHGSRQTWWERRNNFCKRHRGQMLSKVEPKIEKDEPYKGTPTRRELGMIMWMCSNIPTKQLEQMLPIVERVSKDQ